VLKCADNQGVVTSGLRDADAAVAIDHPTPETIAAAVRMLLADPAQRARIAGHAAQLVDGRGAERVALAMAPLVRLRPARDDDARPMLAWRNHPSTRAYFRDPRPVPEADHVAWWSRTLASPDRALLVGAVGSIEIGVLRLDAAGEAAEVSIYLDPDLTGLGLGTALLTAGQRWVTEKRPAICRLIADIDPDNLSSQRAFTAAGFTVNDGRWTWSVA
jgi:RimJ/RimL family protein N-acetyltransferase